MKKNNKGFTLVELLVVIMLMLSVLGVAVVSFLNVSNNKKKEAWELVKSQIETAAVEYFTVNEYLFEGLPNNDVMGRITIGKLVEEDYLNKVTNPITGNTVNNCSSVKVTRKDFAIKTTYEESELADNCESNLLVVSEPGSPSGTIEYYDENDKLVTLDDNSGWFNINKLGESTNENLKKLKICINGKTNNNGPIASVAITSTKYGNFKVDRQGDDFCTILDKDGIYSNLIMTMTNSNGKTWKTYNTVKKDTIKPRGEMVIEKSEAWASKKVSLTLSGEDNVSGIDSSNINDNNYFKGNKGDLLWGPVKSSYTFSNVSIYNGSTKSLTMKITDVAGNTNEDITSNYTLYTSCQPENLVSVGDWKDNGERKTCGSKPGTLQIEQLLSQKDINSLETCDSITRNVEYSVGVCDTTPPSITIRIYKKSAAGTGAGKGSLVKSVTLSGEVGTDINGLGWFNKEEAPYGFYIEYSSNEDLNSVLWYWNNSSLTWDEAQSNTYKWNSANQSFKDGGSSNKGSSKTGHVTIEAQGARRGRLYFEDKSGNLTKVTMSLNMDRTAPKIEYKTNPTAKSCGGKSGVYIKYNVSDTISGVKEVYHYYGNETGAKSYNYISDFDIKVESFNSQGHNGPYTIERTWAVGNPSGCASENPAGPNTSWCYYNNTAVKDYAGNTATGISSSCSKVGGK